MAATRTLSLLAGLVASSASAGLIEEDTTLKTLVLVDDWATLETHSMFFDHVRG